MINKKYILDLTEEIMNIDSPSGFCKKVVDRIESEANKFKLDFKRTKKGNGIITIPGETDYTIGLSVHVDTLGAMVRSITSNGDLKFTNIGGPCWPTIDGEYCKIYTRDNKVYTGTILSQYPAVHVYKDANSAPRKPENMIVRIDEVVKNKEDVMKLGIENGNFICFDTKTTITNSGYIKSRFLDDKINVASIFGLIEMLSKEKITPKYTLKIIISTYEEVGHGASSIPEVDEFISVDMGCIGEDLLCDEHMVSICAKDSTGPYDYDIVNKLNTLAKDNKINSCVDIYPFYGSDTSAALRAGNDFKSGLLGPGVHASHGMERTHIDAIVNTIKLLKLYVTN